MTTPSAKTDTKSGWSEAGVRFTGALAETALRYSAGTERTSSREKQGKHEPSCSDADRPIDPGRHGDPPARDTGVDFSFVNEESSERRR